ncbi:MAG: DNA-formamidopyrimidine glycosylase family protein [Planctomycetota bacterium]
MPELPEVERGRVQAEKACVGKTIKKVFSSKDEIVYAGVTHTKFARTLKGRKVQAARRRGKQLWLELDGDGPQPLIHFGMTGSFRVYTDPDERPRFCKFELELDDGSYFAFKNSRRLGRIKLRQDPLNEDPIAGLGPDPYLEPPTAADFREMVKARRSIMKSLLMNQSFIAGVGNWIADEILYQAKISPHRKSDDLSDAEINRVRTKLLAIVDKAVDAGADYKKFPKSWLFHRRWDIRESRKEDVLDAKGNEVRFDKIGGRTTAWVPALQS